MSLPFLPGNTFVDPTKTRFHKSQGCSFYNGYSKMDAPAAIGGGPSATIGADPIMNASLDELLATASGLTYGPAKKDPPVEFIPAHVAFDKKVLTFNAYFKQAVPESPLEHYRVRFVKFYYYLEDDSISVVEPEVENSGIPQGKMIKRQKLPKDNYGNTWTWKDINLGQDVTFYGKVFRVYDCNNWTRDYLTREGIVVNAPEDPPVDPYTLSRTRYDNPDNSFTTHSTFDKLKQFMELDRRVLRFYAVWDDRENMFGEIRPYVIHYFLADDSAEIREVHENNSGRDPFPVLINRHRFPKNPTNLPLEFPVITMEASEDEFEGQYVGPADLVLGQTVQLYGRRFLLYDCDGFTRDFYKHNFGMDDAALAPVDVSQPQAQPVKRELPPTIGYGSHEDSLGSVKSIVPKPPKKDYVKILENNGKLLRFQARVISDRPEDQQRQFIINYRLSDDYISVFEPLQRNSGIVGGKFLEYMLCPKPESDPNNPTYYTLKDFVIGKTLVINKYKFKLNDADVFVLNWMRANRDEVTAEQIKSVENMLDPDTSKNLGLDVDRRELIKKVQDQLKFNNYLNHNNLEKSFRELDTDGSGSLEKAEVAKLCRKYEVPIDEQLLSEILDIADRNGDGEIDYGEFIGFMVAE